jgi:endogenous inhibitor of DNA gyrase (YacG/DUF329 family)
MPRHRPCPICGRPVEDPGNLQNSTDSRTSQEREGVGSSDARELFPFCSRRCRLIDLGRWLEGEYRIPGQSAAGQEAERGDDGEDSA